MINIYKQSRWKRKREYILKRDGYLCKESLRYGKHVKADVVHHIYPVESYPELKFVDWNLISLSAEQHNKMHDRDTHALTEAGKSLQERHRADYLGWCRAHGVEPH